ncbi:MAG TPA: hypothetical protein VI942_02110 [Thermoanaerobaculia bacterium]|nr:hypothetical protein [Thermoanaerobaculia bacterium]
MPERLRTQVFAAGIAAVLTAGAAGAQLRVLRTDELELVHFGTLRYLVPHTARCFENAYEFHHETFGWTPTEPVALLIHDFYDHGNAAASSVPNNYILAAASPFSYAFEIIPGNEHINWMLNHELVHVLASDMAADRDLAARKLFQGKVYPSQEQPLSMLWSYLTSPRLYSPRWYHEGIASFMETWMAGGLGRGQGAYDEMAFRTIVRDGKEIHDLLGFETAATTVDFQVGANAYLYGTRFMTYLALEHGPEKLIEWVARTPGTAPFYATRFREVFGMPLEQAWNEWIAAEALFQQANLDRLRENPVTATTPLSERALGSVSRPAIDRAGGSVYMGVNYPGQVAHLARLDLGTGKLEKLLDLKGVSLFWVTSIALDPAAGRLFYITDNNHYRDLNVLDLGSGETRRLQRDARVGDLAFDPASRSLWGVRHYNGISTLVRIPPPYDEWHQVHSFDYGTDAYSLDVSPDGSRLAAALTQVDGSQELALFDTAKLLAGDASYEVLGEFENSSPADFVFSSDGKFLYGSSFYSGVSNLYRYRFADGEIEPLTNADSGLFRPVPLDDETLFALQYTAEGFQPVTLPIRPVESIKSIDFLGTVLSEKRPIVREWNVGSPAEIDLAAKTRYDGDFTILGSMDLSSVYPIVEGYKDSPAAGVRFDFRDLFSLSQLKLTLSYSPDSELESEEALHALAEFRYLEWSAHASWNRADFYDLFGPTKTGRKGYALGLEYQTSLIQDLPNRQLDFHVAATGYGDMDTLPGFQNVASPATELVEAETGIHYKSVRNSLGSIETEEGVDLTVTGGDQLVSGEHFPWAHADLALGTGLPIDHSSLWLRTSIGGAFGDRDSPFGNVFFGGFRNNYVDHQEYRRYHDLLAFPGFEIDEIQAHNFGKAMLEWNLPPIRPRGGTSSAHVNWIGAALFGGVLASDIDHDRLRREYTTAGVQIDTRFTVLTHLQFTLSLGAAYGKEQGGESVDEFMVSLKLPPL